MELVTPVIEFLAKRHESSGAPSVDLGVPITLLFIDIEGSSSLTTRLDAKEVQKLIHAHNGTVRRAIESYNGNEVQYTGRGIGASFFSASRAVGCALYIQQVLLKRNAANPEDAVNVRVGVTVGEPIADDNDAFYASGQVARQICELAKPGQVLVSDLVRQLVDGKGFVFESIGTKMFKDFAEPVTLYKLRLE